MSVEKASGKVESGVGNEVILVGHPVTTNPFIIMLINMTVVFAVLIGLSLMIRLIHIVDPTKSAPKTAVQLTAPIPAADAAATAEDKNLTAAVIAAAVAAYGCSEAKIVAIRPAGSSVWTNTARLTGIRNTVN